MSISSRHSDRATIPGFLERRDLYLIRAARETRDLRGRTAIFGEVARRAIGDPGVPEVIDDAIGIVDSRIDCADFTLTGVLRLLGHPLTGSQLTEFDRARLEGAATGFRFWWDQPGEDSMCFHTENHRALFHSAEMIAGQSHPDVTFSLTRASGTYHRQHGERALREWCLHRGQVGWSEWLSSTYIEHHLAALLNTYEYAHEPTLRDLAGDLLDIMLVELALHARDGILVASQGRIYPRTLRDARDSGVASIAWMLWGGDGTPDPCSVGAVSLATSTYLPPAIVDVLGRAEGPETIRQHMSFDVEEVGELGVGQTPEERARVFWALGEFGHPNAWRDSAIVSTRYGQDLDTSPQSYGQDYENQIASHGRIVDPLRDRHALSAVDVTTRRRPGAALSSAQVFRPGAPGYQQHVWQATLGPKAQVFSTAPGSMRDDERPGWWNGNSVLPAVVQRDDWAVVMHRGLTNQPLAFSHVRWPKEEFDEELRTGSWWIGRHGEGLVGLWCSVPCEEILLTGEDQGALELRTTEADGSWVCRIGSSIPVADFAAQLQAMIPQEDANGSVHLRIEQTTEATVHWPGRLVFDGAPEAANSHCRLDSPYGNAHLRESWVLSCEDTSLRIPLEESLRQVRENN